MKTTSRSFWIGALILFVGCLSSGCTNVNMPQKQPMMAKIPSTIEVPSTVHVISSRVGDWSELSPGRYSLVYENKQAYYFKTEGGKIRRSSIYGPGDANGGIEYNKDLGHFCIFAEAPYSKQGEIPAYMAKKEQGDTDETFRYPQGWLLEEQTADWKFEFN